MECLRMLRHPTLRPLMQTRGGGLGPKANLRPLQCPTQPAFRTRTAQSGQVRNLHGARRPTSFTASRAFRTVRSSKTGRRFESTSAKPAENLSLSQRLKKLSREYGWSAVGVYLLLSVADFPFCFLLVRWVGADKIGYYEHIVLDKVKEWVKWPLGGEAQEMVDGAMQEVGGKVKEVVRLEDVRDGEQRLLEEDTTYVVEDHGYSEAQKANSGSNAGLWTQLVLAYAIHKSFIFVRVPLTAAITPKVVKTLRGWGWNIGKRPAKKIASSSTPGVNTKGSGVKPDGS